MEPELHQCVSSQDAASEELEGGQVTSILQTQTPGFFSFGVILRKEIMIQSPQTWHYKGERSRVNLTVLLRLC